MKIKLKNITKTLTFLSLALFASFLLTASSDSVSVSAAPGDSKKECRALATEKGLVEATDENFDKNLGEETGYWFWDVGDDQNGDGNKNDPYQSCNVHVDQGTCNSYGGEFAIGLYGSGAAAACIINKGADPGEGETCGDFKGCSDVADPYCDDKYGTKSLRDACEKGFYGGTDACNKLRGKNKTACEQGAKAREENFPEGEEVGGGKGPECATALLPASLCANDGKGIWALLLLIITILAAGVGIVAVGGLVYAAILYTSASDDEGQVKKAKDMIKNVAIGIVTFALMWSLLQFVIPGGIFDRRVSTSIPVTNNPNNNNGGGGNNNNNGGGRDVTVADVRTIRNLRDASTTSGGSVLKKDMLYRSGALNNLNPKNSKRLGELLGGNATIIDLRTLEQQRDDPDKSVPGVRRVSVPTPGFLDASMAVNNGAKASERRQQLGRALKIAANSNGPILVHCSAGKDRTGWFVAMIMHIAGASQQQIMREYMKSRESWPNGVKPAWLNNGFNAARRQYGSIDNYLRNGLGLSKSDITKLRNKFKA